MPSRIHRTIATVAAAHAYGGPPRGDRSTDDRNGAGRAVALPRCHDHTVGETRARDACDGSTGDGGRDLVVAWASNRLECRSRGIDHPAPTKWLREGHHAYFVLEFARDLS